MLACQLVKDPAAHLTAAVLGWDYPLSREGLALAALIDRISELYAVTVAHATGGKVTVPPAPYPRPIPSGADDPTPLADDVAAILDAIGTDSPT